MAEQVPCNSLQLFQLTAATQQPPGPVRIYDFLQNFPQQCFALSVYVCIPVRMQWAGGNGWGTISSRPRLSKQLRDSLFHHCLNVSLLFESLSTRCSTLANQFLKKLYILMQIVLVMPFGSPCIKCNASSMTTLESLHSGELHVLLFYAPFNAFKTHP